MKNKFKLKIELVPSSVWYSSLYRLLPRQVWHRTKERLFAEEGRKCYICSYKQGPLSAHEFWEYNDDEHIQKLVAVHHLCSLCHKIKHIGFWCHTADGRAKLGEQGLDREGLIEHFCNVNNCAKKEFLEHEEKAFDLWRERSKHEWEQDFGKYKDFIEQ